MTLWIEQKYIGLVSPRLERFKKKSDKLYNFRCPFCGDSSKNKIKARAYLFLNKDHMLYKCHNCAFSTNLYGLLNFIDTSLANAYKLEKFGESNKLANNTTELVIPKSRIPRANPLLKIGCEVIKNLEDNHPAVQYLNSRKIPKSRYIDLYYIDDFSKLAEINPAYKNRLAKEQRIIIPFKNIEGKFTGVQGRALGNNPLRYISVRFENESLIYGYEYITIHKDVFCLEGPFDSMFVDNGLAVSGTNLKNLDHYIPKDKMIMVFDNEPRNKEVVKIMEKMIRYGYRMVIWPNYWKYKDINEGIIDGVSKSELMTILYNNTFSDLKLKLAIRDWKK